MRLLDQLALPHRAVLLLHFVEDFSLEEIARITETQIGTVKSRLPAFDLTAATSSGSDREPSRQYCGSKSSC